MTDVNANSDVNISSNDDFEGGDQPLAVISPYTLSPIYEYLTK